MISYMQRVCMRSYDHHVLQRIGSAQVSRVLPLYHRPLVLVLSLCKAYPNTEASIYLIMHAFYFDNGLGHSISHK